MVSTMFAVRSCQSIQNHEEHATGQQQDEADHGRAIHTDHHPAMSRAMARKSRAIVILRPPSWVAP